MKDLFSFDGRDAKKKMAACEILKKVHLASTTPTPLLPKAEVPSRFVFRPFPKHPPSSLPASELIVLSFNTHNNQALQPGALDVVADVLEGASVVVLQECNSTDQKPVMALAEAMSVRAKKRGGGPFEVVLSEPGCNASINHGVATKMQGAKRHALLYDASLVRVIKSTTLLCDLPLKTQPLPISYAPLAVRLRLLKALPGSSDLVVLSVHCAPSDPERKQDWKNLRAMLGNKINVLHHHGLWGAAVGSIAINHRDLSALPPLLLAGDFNGSQKELQDAFSAHEERAEVDAGTGGGGGRLHRGLTGLAPSLLPQFSDAMLTNALDSKAYDNILIEDGSQLAFAVRGTHVCGSNSDVSDHQPIYLHLKAQAVLEDAAVIDLGGALKKMQIGKK